MFEEVRKKEETEAGRNYERESGQVEESEEGRKLRVK